MPHIQRYVRELCKGYFRCWSYGYYLLLLLSCFLSSGALESKPMSSSTILYNKNSIAHNHHTNIHPLVITTLQVLYMDVYSSTLHRADNHVGWLDDCLHYCQPGPIDEWSVFLYNALLGAEALAEMGEMGKIEEVASADDGLEGKTENGSEVDKGADRERKGKRKRRLKHKIKLSRRNKLRTRQTPEGAEGKCVFAIGSSAVYLVQNYTRHVLPDYDVRVFV